MSRPPSPSTTSSAPKKWWQRLYDWMIYEDKGKWLEDMRGSLSLTASIIATITFQAALNPPGGVLELQGKVFKDEDRKCYLSSNDLCPGQAVLAVVYPVGYCGFLACNTICFIASLSVCLLLVSGLNLNHAFTTWLLLIGMWITITSLALTYLFGAVMVTPYFVAGMTDSVFSRLVLAWIALLAVVGFLVLIRFIPRVVKCIKSCYRCATSAKNEITSISGA